MLEEEEDFLFVTTLSRSHSANVRIRIAQEWENGILHGLHHNAISVTVDGHQRTHDTDRIETSGMLAILKQWLQDGQ